MQMKTFDDIQIDEKVYYAIIDKDFNISLPKISYVAHKQQEPFERCWKITLSNFLKFYAYKCRIDAEAYYGDDYDDKMIIYSMDEESLKNAVEDNIYRRINEYEYRLRDVKSQLSELRKKEKIYKKQISTLESKLS